MSESKEGVKGESFSREKIKCTSSATSMWPYHANDCPTYIHGSTPTTSERWELEFALDEHSKHLFLSAGWEPISAGMEGGSICIWFRRKAVSK